jgi:hypothetical protein
LDVHADIILQTGVTTVLRVSELALQLNTLKGEETNLEMWILLPGITITTTTTVIHYDLS